jgi:magnesium chelatase family protein
MSVARTSTVTFQGAKALAVDVQVQISQGLPSFTIVGLANKAVAESRERVRAALAIIGISLPLKRLLVNLAPADLAKEGSHFDLPIAVAILAAMELVPRESVEDLCVMGELSLDAVVQPVPGILPAALHAAEAEKAFVCPARQGAEALWATPRGLLATPNLQSLIAHLRGTDFLPTPRRMRLPPGDDLPDLADVTGQALARRALEIAATGRHHLMMIGPPGSGKSMLAQRLPGLLPALSAREALEVAVIRSLSGPVEDGAISARRPFRSPHHSASQAALVGGGSRVRPGEVSLAHFGVLFLDELPEFSRAALEALREPLEAREVVISRVGSKLSFPAEFQLVAAMNPCVCGYLGMPGRECGRAPACGRDYRAKLSGPLLDRIDMFVDVTPVPPRDIVRGERGEASPPVAERVSAAAELARERGLPPNAELSLDRLRPMVTAEGLALLEKATERLGLSTRGMLRVLRVARSIADLAGSGGVDRHHVGEALSYRSKVL